jgi:hypothetical protein
MSNNISSTDHKVIFGHSVADYKVIFGHSVADYKVIFGHSVTGWSDNKGILTKNSIIRRVVQNIDNVASYNSRNIYTYEKSYDPVNKNDTLILERPRFDIRGIRLRFRINVNNYFKESTSIGSFIRTVTRLLTTIDSLDMLFIIDLTQCTQIKIKSYIDILIKVSTTDALFTNLFLICSDTIYNDIKLKNNFCMYCCKSTELDKLLGDTNPYPVNETDHQIPCNVFNDFNVSTHHILLNFNDIYFSTVHAVSIYQLTSHINSSINVTKLYSKKYITNQLIIVCIEKLINLIHINELFTNYNMMNDLIVCLPDFPVIPENNTDTVIRDRVRNLQNNYRDIVDYCAKYMIRTSSIELTGVLIKKNIYKNIIAIDLDKNAITQKYNEVTKIYDNSAIIFGFESIGIPGILRDICNVCVQLDSRQSINVVSTVSIIISSI